MYWAFANETIVKFLPINKFLMFLYFYGQPQSCCILFITEGFILTLIKIPRKIMLTEVASSKLAQGLNRGLN